jgi:hypothetical protein
MVDATEEVDVRTRVLNGVAVPSVEPEAGRDYYPGHEMTSIPSLRRHVRRGDSVVVVGGGWGTTTVVAARMTHFEGEVTTFEASSEMLETIERTLAVNRVADLVTVEHAAIGSVPDSNEQYFGPADGASLPPTAVPECDVLELDCEGAELEILRALDVSPRTIVVEIHPHLGSPREDVVATLADQGYEIEDEGPVAPDGSDDMSVITAELPGDE